jgi:hypothetical protein
MKKTWFLAYIAGSSTRIHPPSFFGYGGIRGVKGSSGKEKD